MTSDLETLIERTRANVAKLQDDLRFEQRLLSRLIGEKSQQPNKRDVANVPQRPLVRVCTFSLTIWSMAV